MLILFVIISRLRLVDRIARRQLNVQTRSANKRIFLVISIRAAPFRRVEVLARRVEPPRRLSAYEVLPATEKSGPGALAGRRSRPGRLVLERDWPTVQRVNRRVAKTSGSQRWARGIEPELTPNLLLLPNSSIEDLGRGKTDAPLGVDSR